MLRQNQLERLLLSRFSDYAPICKYALELTQAESMFVPLVRTFRPSRFFLRTNGLAYFASLSAMNKKVL
jgi:hypothetical protein